MDVDFLLVVVEGKLRKLDNLLVIVYFLFLEEAFFLGIGSSGTGSSILLGLKFFLESLYEGYSYFISSTEF